MAIQRAGLKFGTWEQEGTSKSEVLARLPGGSIAAVFASRVDAVGTAVQVLTSDAEAEVWTKTGIQASEAIRDARSGRSLVARLLFGFGDEELMVRDLLRQTDEGRSVLVVRAASREALKHLGGAAHIYHFGVWTIGPIR